MAVLTGVQMGRYLIGAGFPADKLARMIAIGYAESGGNTVAIGPPPSQPPAADGGRGYGWLQIESVHSDKIPNFFPPSNTWQDPGANAAAGLVIYGMQGLNAWTSNSNGAADKHQGQANKDALEAAALGGLSVGSIVGGAQDVTGNPLSDAASAITNVAKEPLAILDWLKQPGTIMRIAKFTGGMIAMTVGVYAIVEGKIALPAAAKATQVVAGVTPGRAATNAIRRTRTATAVREATAAPKGA